MPVSGKEAPSGYITREQAVELLGIKKESFYSYVSRFQVRSFARKGAKQKFYNSTDIERLRSRSQSKFGNEARASHAMRFGEPIVQTSICEITPEGPRYRGHNAIELVRGQWRFESVADLLMEGSGINRSRPWPLAKEESRPNDAPNLAMDQDANSVALCLVSLVVSEASHQLARRRAKLDDYATTRRLIQKSASLAGLLGPSKRVRRFEPQEWVAQALLRGLGGVATDKAVRAVDAALIVSAEHELAPPTVAVRIAASTGANISSCMIAGLVTETGRLQGGGIEAAENVMYRISDGDRRATSVSWFEDQARQLPWFSHPLYGKDPRAALLMELARSVAKDVNRNHLWKFVDRLESSAFCPGTGFALVILSLALGLPKRSAMLMRLIGRMSGWAAHASEQRRAGFMMRPRAKFI